VTEREGDWWRGEREGIEGRDVEGRKGSEGGGERGWGVFGEDWDGRGAREVEGGLVRGCK